jgi:hypothetical protein
VSGGEKRRRDEGGRRKSVVIREKRKIRGAIIPFRPSFSPY